MTFFLLKQCISAGKFLESIGKPDGYPTQEDAETAAKSILTKNVGGELVVMQELSRLKLLPTIIATSNGKETVYR